MFIRRQVAHDRRHRQLKLGQLRAGGLQLGGGCCWYLFESGDFRLDALPPRLVPGGWGRHQGRIVRRISILRLVEIGE